MTRDKQEEALLNALTRSHFQWRTIEQLSRVAQADLLTTRELLKGIGARRSTGQREVYTLDAAEAVEMPAIEHDEGGEGD
jgi:hypothetical protein